MPLDFDSTRAPLTSRDFVALALAVKNARDNDEADWIEWKSTLDLASAKGRSSVARAVVGLANRIPAAASAHCEGRSYLLVGIQPGDPAGIEEVDPAVLEDRLRPYLGDDGPRFAPHWVSIEGRSILVIEVAAPRDGDPVHHIRKEGPDIRDGDIFVRRGAKTVRPSSVELGRLFQRAKSAPEIHGITLALAEPRELPTIDFSHEAVEGWISSTRQRLLAALPRPRTQGDRYPASFVGESALSAFSRDFAAGIAGAVARKEEDRTPEQYKDEVEDYLGRCRGALPYVLLKAAADKLTPVEFQISNQTEENYLSVQVVLHIPGTVEAIRPQVRASNEARLPAPPRPYGPYRLGPMFGARDDGGRLRQIIAGASVHNVNLSSQGDQRTVDIANGGSATLTFSAVDLRPLEQRVPLARVVLLPQVPLDGTVNASWQATSKSVRGVARGGVEIPLAEDPTPVRSLIDAEEQ